MFSSQSLGLICVSSRSLSLPPKKTRNDEMMIVNSATSSKIHVFRYPWWLRNLTISIDNTISFANFSCFFLNNKDFSCWCVALLLFWQNPTNEPCTHLRLPRSWTQNYKEFLEVRGERNGGEMLQQSGAPKGNWVVSWYVLMITPENWGRCPFWLIFFKGVETTKEEKNHLPT